ncbi:hypothetical protein P0D88_09495 [Paraburkholderia sp. RL18-103-BIB-C]|jgi:hypothetical protein|uniref:hypothetical protein n=1 Tax=unclassified Paraburkholderia TaxID=2615204 RepID=UPI0038B81D94
MCCAIVALTMTLLAGWRSVSDTLGGRAGRLRRIAIVVIAIGAAAGSAMAADQFAAAGEGAPSLVTRLVGVPVCGHFIR